MNLIIRNEEELKDILKKVSDGELSAFGKILKNYQHYAYSVAFRVLLNEDDAKDVVQECFIRIWKNIKSYNDKVKFTTWMYKIVINLCYDRLRRNKRDKEKREDFVEELTINFEDPEKILTNKEQAEMIKYISNGLPKKQRMIFVLRDLEELTTEEVSKVLEISIESVKSNLCIARKTIRTKLINWRLCNEL